MSQVLLFSLAAAANPILLTATTVMLLLPNPKRLLLGYLLGAYFISISLGLVIVFALQGSSVVDTTKNTLSPAADIALGLILVLVAGLEKRHHASSGQRTKKPADEPEKTPRWREFLNKGKPRDTFVVGALLTLPGAAYLAGLSQISKQSLSTTATVLCVVGFNLVMLAFLEIPLVGYTFAPDWTRKALDRFKDILNRDGERILLIAALVLGIALVARGLVELLG